MAWASRCAWLFRHAVSQHGRAASLASPALQGEPSSGSLGRPRGPAGLDLCDVGASADERQPLRRVHRTIRRACVTEPTTEPQPRCPVTSGSASRADGSVVLKPWVIDPVFVALPRRRSPVITRDCRSAQVAAPEGGSISQGCAGQRVPVLSRPSLCPRIVRRTGPVVVPRA